MPDHSICAQTRSLLWLMLAASVLAAIGINTRAEAQTNSLPARIPQPAMSSITGPAASPATNFPPIKCVDLISDLNNESREMRAAFLYVAGKDGAPCDPAPLRGAKAELEAKWEIQVGLFSLKPDSPDTPQLATQMTIPGVLVILKGGGRSPVRGSITESNLIGGFYAAMSAGGCCPLGTDNH